MALGDDILARLLARGERARVTGSQRVVRESFQGVDSPYWTLSLAERDQMHAVLERAATAGAVSLSWARQGGEDRPLSQVTLTDVDRLAAFLRVATVADAVRRAAHTLAPWSGHPRVQDLLAAWSRLRKVRSLGPESASDFADALRVVEAMGAASEDRLARPLSVALFGRSKRLEALYTHLDVLTSEATSAPARHWSEVLGALGIRKEPQPLLIAGQGQLELAQGPPVAIAQPFVGIATHALRAYRGMAGWLLSVENLTTFHQCSELLAGGDRGVIVYTAGMPSPSWERAYTCLLAGLPVSTRLFHWGDHDEGGFRIAARLASACTAAGRTSLPWQMQVDQGAPASATQHAAMAAAARRAGWESLARSLPFLLLEQEFQRPTLPELDGYD